MSENMSIVVTGVGGQGVLLASDLLSEVALIHGLQAKKADVHGMAQRGGSVISYVKFGPTVYSPLVEKRGAHILCAFEPLEMIRYLAYVHKKSHIVFNTGRVYPSSAVLGKVPYPEKPEEIAQKYCESVLPMDATEMAVALGLPNAVNLIMLGSISSWLPFSPEEWNKAIEKKVKAKYVEINKKAFEKGKEAVRIR